MELKSIYLTIAFSVLVIVALCYVTSCTYSITQVHTSGQETDIIDETATNSPTTSIRLPAAIL
jgi:hypothetical protein